MAGADSTNVVEVEIRARLDVLERDLARARQRLVQFDRAAAGGKKGLAEIQGTSSRAAEALRNLSNQLAILQGPLGPIAGRVSFLATGLGRIGFVGLGASLALTGLAFAVKKSIDAFTQLEHEQATYNGVLQATGHVAGRTAEDIENLAVSIRKSSTATEGSVRSASAILLTFRSVSGETFDEALKLSQDLAAVGFGSITSAALMMGKALEDPILGLTAMRRVGVKFSESQNELIKSLIETGRRAEAMEVILEGVRRQVGGAGAAQANTITGAWNQFSEALNNWQERSGGWIAKLTNLKGLIQGVANALDRATDAADRANSAEGKLADLESKRATQLKYKGANVRLLDEQIAAARLVVEYERLAKALNKAELEAGTTVERLESMIGATSGAVNKLREEEAQLRRNALAQEVYNAIKDAGKNSLIELGPHQKKEIEDRVKINFYLKNSSALLQQYVGLLGDSASVSLQVAAARAGLNDAIKAGVDLTPKEIADIEERTRVQALGIDAMRSQADASKIEAAALGLGTAAATSLRLEQERLAAARRANQRLTPENVEGIRREAVAAGEAAEALEKLRVRREAAYERQTIGLSDADVAIARQLRGIYGDDIPAALASWEAAQLRVNESLRESKGMITDFASGMTKDIANGTRFLEAMTSAIGRLRDRLIDMAFNNVVSNAFGGLIGAGGSGGIFTGTGTQASMGGGAGGGVFGGSVIPGLLHAGGIAGSAPSFGRAVPTAAFAMAPQLHGGKLPWNPATEMPAILDRREEVGYPAQLAQKYGGGEITVGGPTIIVQGDASEKVVGMISEELGKFMVKLPATIRDVVSDARSRRML